MNQPGIRLKESIQRARKQNISRETKEALDESSDSEPSNLVESSESGDETTTDEEWEDGKLSGVDKEVVFYRE